MPIATKACLLVGGSLSSDDSNYFKLKQFVTINQICVEGVNGTASCSFYLCKAF